MKKLNVAVVGLSFGLEFVPIYLEHPDVEKVYLVPFFVPRKTPKTGQIRPKPLGGARAHANGAHSGSQAVTLESPAPGRTWRPVAALQPILPSPAVRRRIRRSHPELAGG